eukprot:3677991-Heterocapsa_arctica.AAC.1
MEPAMRQGWALDYASKELKGDSEVIRFRTPRGAHGRQSCRSGGCQTPRLCAEYASKDLTGDRE